MNIKLFNAIFLFSMGVVLLLLTTLALSKYIFETIDYGLGLIAISFILSGILSIFDSKDK